MRDEMAMTTNVKRFLASVRELADRPLGVEGMGLLWGLPGEGKSTTVAFARNSLDGVYLRANACWNVTSMLGALMIELGLPAQRFRSPMLDAAIRMLAENERPLFVDEADYLLGQEAMIDVLRDIYDYAKVPVVLIGMEEFARKVQTRGKFARRITQWVEFSGINATDTRVLADTLCELKVADDLLMRLHHAARANIGRMTTGLSRIERFGKTNGLATVSLSDWGDRPLFFDQPTFSRRHGCQV